MKKLDVLFNNIKTMESKGSMEKTIHELHFDSRKVASDDLFIALKGVSVDGHGFIEKAIEKGASTILLEEFPEVLNKDITYIKVMDTSKTLGKLASNFYDNPSQKLKLIGVTGTNGKTTTTTLLYETFEKLGFKSALLSTIKIRIHKEEIKATHTTPDIITINRILNQAVEQGCDYAFMEVSSHGIHQNRIEGLSFKIAAFTNITHDHLDYHNTFREYLETKKRFFDELSKDAIALTNIDDKNGMVMLQNTKAEKKSYALKSMADYKGKIIESGLTGMLLEYNSKEFWTSIIGHFNAYNLLTVFAITDLLGVENTESLQAISTLGNVEGRFETFVTKETKITCVVDYAHTPDALENVLKTISDIRTGNEKLITVFGCGGNRDKEKRPEMGKIAAHFSDQVIITSDNPRDESPEEIITEIETGIPSENSHKTMSVSNRKEAIKIALKFSESNDIVLVAGKGHETYQEIKGERTHFDDLETIKELSKTLKK